jgi:hypothetical protein
MPMDQATYNSLVAHRTELATMAISELMTTLVDCIADGKREQAKDIQDRIDILFAVANAETLKVEFTE